MGEEATKTIQTRVHVASEERSWLHDARPASREIFNQTVRLKQQGYTRTEIQREVDRDDFLRNNKCAVVGKALQTWASYRSFKEWWENQDDLMEASRRRRVPTNLVRTRIAWREKTKLDSTTMNYRTHKTQPQVRLVRLSGSGRVSRPTSSRSLAEQGVLTHG